MCKSAFDKNRRIYHIFGDCFNTSGTNVYAADISGEAIQFDVFCASYPSIGSGNALQDTCGQGTCSSYTSTSSYSSKLDSLCSSVKSWDDTRMDCTYARWSISATAGCDSGNVVKYCVSSSPSPTPSPSASTAGECDRCASLVGEQWTGLSGKPCLDCGCAQLA